MKNFFDFWTFLNINREKNFPLKPHFLLQVVGNKIEVVNTGAFHGLHNLRELSLRANSIHTVKEKAFTGSIFISIYLFIFEKKTSV